MACEELQKRDRFAVTYLSTQTQLCIIKFTGKYTRCYQRAATTFTRGIIHDGKNSRAIIPAPRKAKPQQVRTPTRGVSKRPKQVLTTSSLPGKGRAGGAREIPPNLPLTPQRRAGQQPWSSADPASRGGGGGGASMSWGGQEAQLSLAHGSTTSSGTAAASPPHLSGFAEIYILFLPSCPQPVHTPQRRQVVNHSSTAGPPAQVHIMTATTSLPPSNLSGSNLLAVPGVGGEGEQEFFFPG